MDTNGYSLSDIAAASNGMNGFGGEGIWFLLLIVLLGGGGFGWNRNDGFNTFATAASQNELLLGQKFDNVANSFSAIDNKIDRLGNGIADATFALNNSIKDGNAMVAGRVVDEGRGLQTQMCQAFADTNATTISQTQKILDAIAQNKIDSLQAQVSELKTQNMFCGIPRINPYGYGVYPYQGCGCNCGGYAG